MAVSIRRQARSAKQGRAGSARSRLLALRARGPKMRGRATMTQLHTSDILPPNPPRILPLQNGDRLTRDEFERRYNAMPHVNKAQLIEGVVYMPSPVTHTHHSNPHFNFIGWLHGYAMYTPGVEGGDNGSLRLDLDNEPQPDAYLIIRSDHGVEFGLKTATLSAVPSWWVKCRPAVRVLTCTPSSRRTGETASANMSSGACSIARLIGSCCGRAIRAAPARRGWSISQRGLAGTLARSSGPHQR